MASRGLFVVGWLLFEGFFFWSIYQQGLLGAEPGNIIGALTAFPNITLRNKFV